MSDFPVFSLARRNNTEQFLADYRTFLRILPDDDTPEGGGDFAVEVRNFDGNLAQGQIRVLVDCERITYVAVLKHWSWDQFLIVPYSNFDFPATDEELLTDHDGGGCLRVLQLWNARTIHCWLLARSYCVGELTAADYESAWSLFSHGMTDYNVNPAVLERTGVPVYRLDDPRLDYKKTEMQNFRSLDMRDMQLHGYFTPQVFESAVVDWQKLPPERLAAAGTKSISAVYQFDLTVEQLTAQLAGDGLDFTGVVPGDVRLQSKLPRDGQFKELFWESDDLQCQDCAPALFYQVSTKRLLGIGIADRRIVIMKYPVGDDKSFPAISGADDIVILLAKI